MTTYRYEAVNRQGSLLTGELAASDRQGALTRLHASGLTVLALSETPGRRLRGRRVQTADLALFSRQLSAMLEAGVPAAQAIGALSSQTQNAALRDALLDITAAVEGGSGLSDAFGRHPALFSPLYCAMLRAGELGGTLDASLLRLSEQLQKEKQVQDNIRTATAYPRLIGAFALAMLLAMLLLIVPVFEGFLPSGAAVNPVTAGIFALSRLLRSAFVLWAAAALAATLAVRRWTRSAAARRIWERHKLSLPVFGPILHRAVIARFCRTLATLLRGGIPVLEALAGAGPTSGSDLLAAAVAEASGKIEAGRDIARPLADSGLFPPMVLNMVAVGEESGRLPELLDKAAEFYEEEVAAMTRGLGTLLEPLLLVAIGLLIGGMLLALYLPIITAVTSL